MVLLRYYALCNLTSGCDALAVPDARLGNATVAFSKTIKADTLKASRHTAYAKLQTPVCTFNGESWQPQLSLQKGSKACHGAVLLLTQHEK